MYIKSVRNGIFPTMTVGLFLVVVRVGRCWEGGKGMHFWHAGVYMAFEIGITAADFFFFK